jgi:DNA mismatch repair protein MutS
MKSEQTPLMRQYREIKKRYSDGILFFQVGDFYETFYDDAEDVSRLLNIALTTRDKDKENPVPLAGVPIHAAEAYIAKLMQAGRKVVICDQVEKPSEAKGVVKRTVTDVITPGTSLSSATLSEKENNYLLSLIAHDEQCGFAFLDVSTGEFSAGVDTLDVVEHLLAGYAIREAIVPEGSRGIASMIVERNPSSYINEIDQYRFGAAPARETLCAHFGIEHLHCFGIEDKPLATAAAGALLGYVKELRQSDLNHITGVRLFTSGETLFMDGETLHNLEIFEPIMGAPETTLIYHIDRSVTAAGARELRSWLREPSRSIDVINGRLDGIAAFCSDQVALRELRRSLYRFPDIERIVSRVSARKAGPRELVSLADALGRVPEIEKTTRNISAEIVVRLRRNLLEEPAALQLIRDSIDPEGPPNLREAGVIRKGFDSDLDRLIGESEAGKRWIASLQETEKKRTGIPSLKVGYNKVFGYYIEVSRVHDRKIPENYIAKQTLVSSQRYVTQELKEREQTIINAESRRIELERRIYEDICERISHESRLLQGIAKTIAVLDVLSSLADLALERAFCRPEITTGNDLLITDGRHPVVEVISGKNFIPNDVHIRPAEKQVLIITGPNMGGKSTYIRQTAIIAILAHMGCYVPASRAVVGLLDRVFTRVGSSDNLAKGQSTFLVEMAETAKILHNCTSRSLVILDEIGRGTSTLDGLSIAWAVTEYLLETEGKRPKTLFATHYHELTELANKFPRIQNLTVDVKEWGDTVLFLYKIQPGATDRSYGIHVAQLAGLPASVIERSREILAMLEEEHVVTQIHSNKPPRQADLFSDTSRIRNRLKGIDIDSITPLEALQMLSDLKRRALEEQ